MRARNTFSPKSNFRKIFNWTQDNQFMKTIIFFPTANDSISTWNKFNMFSRFYDRLDIFFAQWNLAYFVRHLKSKKRHHLNRISTLHWKYNIFLCLLSISWNLVVQWPLPKGKRNHKDLNKPVQGIKIVIF